MKIYRAEKTNNRVSTVYKKVSLQKERIRCSEDKNCFRFFDVKKRCSVLLRMNECSNCYKKGKQHNPTELFPSLLGATCKGCERSSGMGPTTYRKKDFIYNDCYCALALQIQRMSWAKSKDWGNAKK